MENLKNDNDKFQGDTSDLKVLTGMFRDRESTERAYKTLRDRGYTEEDISVIMSETTKKKQYLNTIAPETELETKTAEHASKGTAIGGTIGAAVGVIAALSTSILIPGLGILFAGPIVAGMAGAGAGGIAGGLIGAFVGSGIPEERAKLYETGINEGNVVISVKPKSQEDADYIQKEWRANRGEEIHW